MWGVDLLLCATTSHPPLLRHNKNPGTKGGDLDARAGKMTMSVPERKSGSEGKEEESEDESEILEESPCGRWQKRKEQVGPINQPDQSMDRSG